jgi:hypothetical protein
MARHLFTELRRQLAGRKDVRSPAKLAAWIKAHVAGTNPPLKVRVMSEGLVELRHGMITGYMDGGVIVGVADRKRLYVTEPEVGSLTTRTLGDITRKLGLAWSSIARDVAEQWLESGKEPRRPNPLLAIAGNPARKRDTNPVGVMDAAISTFGKEWLQLTLTEVQAVLADIRSIMEEEPEHSDPYTAARILSSRIGGAKNLRSYVRTLTAGRRNPGGGAQPTPGGRIFGKQMHEMKYEHTSEGPRVHTFTARGTKLEALPDGSVRVFNVKHPVWGEE